MFTGIIEQCGRILDFNKNADGMTIEVLTEFEELLLGESIAVNGVCLTVEKSVGSHAFFVLSPETLDKSNLGSLVVDQIVNLERAATPTTRLSGHWVQGHVDGTGVIREIVKTGNSWKISLGLPRSLLKYVSMKGSISIDGISLTINELNDEQSAIGLMIIPHTWNHTNLQSASAGSVVNIEVDALAKIVERLCQFPKQ